MQTTHWLALASTRWCTGFLDETAHSFDTIKNFVELWGAIDK